MEFALFYEIPVARPWDADTERQAYANTIEQAVAGFSVGIVGNYVEQRYLQPRVMLARLLG